MRKASCRSRSEQCSDDKSDQREVDDCDKIMRGEVRHVTCIPPSRGLRGTGKCEGEMRCSAMRCNPHPQSFSLETHTGCTRHRYVTCVRSSRPLSVESSTRYCRRAASLDVKGRTRVSWLIMRVGYRGVWAMCAVCAVRVEPPLSAPLETGEGVSVSATLLLLRVYFLDHLMPALRVERGEAVQLPKVRWHVGWPVNCNRMGKRREQTDGMWFLQGRSGQRGRVEKIATRLDSLQHIYTHSKA